MSSETKAEPDQAPERKDSKSSKSGESILDDVLNMDFADFDITTEEVCFEGVDEHIQENLEDDLVKEALAQGVDLRTYALEVEEALEVVQVDSINDYLKESSNIASLHKQIRECDQLLESMEKLLGVFQSDLGNISSEIETLQTQSLTMNEKLANRKAVHSQIDVIVAEGVISPDLMECICEKEVNDVYLQYLITLNKKISFFKKKSKSDYACKAEVQPDLDALRVKATDRIREFLLKRIYGLRTPNTNVQIYQQNTLLPFKYFFQFLKQHGKDVSQEICVSYVETLQKVYFSYFRLYLQSLMKLNYEEVADKDDLVGTQEGLKKLFFSTRLTQKTHVFTLGDRSQILADIQGNVIIPHIATKTSSKYHIEQLFRSFNYAVLDNASSEYLFIIEFFNSKSSTAINVFNAIFDKSLHLILEHMSNFLHTSYDTIGALLCIRIVQHFRMIMQQRRIPALDKHFVQLEQLFWPRVKELLNLNIESIKKCEPKRMETVEVRPHYITRRYAEFSASIIAINESWNDPQILQTLLRMKSVFERFLEEMSNLFSKKKDKLVFIMNNCDLVITILTEQTQSPSSELEGFNAKLYKTTQEFIDVELTPFFGGMMKFVVEIETKIKNKEEITCDKHRVESIVKSFATDWRGAIDSINADVLQSFTNFKTGTEVLHGVLTGMILYYQRFLDIMNQQPFSSLPIRSELINRHHVMVEVKKHRTTF